MKQYVTILIVYLARILLRAAYIFPVKNNRILFISYKGRQYSCNPKYVFEFMNKKYGNQYEYIWCINEELPQIPVKVKTAKYLSLKYCLYMMTSRYIIANEGIDTIFPFRKQQVIVNTWHGMNYKKLSSDSPVYSRRKKVIQVWQKIRSRETAHLTSPCAFYTKINSEYFFIPPGKFLPIGYPRNDIFFGDKDVMREKVTNYYNILPEKKIVLYAPTFRKHDSHNAAFNIDIDISKIILSLQEKFNGNFVCICRLHHDSIQGNIPGSEHIILGADYPDMQEMLCAADVLITDYSSSMWDFSLTFNPCFIYCPDLDEYRKTQGLALPIEELPFPYAITNEQLIENINNFEKEIYVEALKKYHRDMGAYETGRACEHLCNIMFESGELKTS